MKKLITLLIVLIGYVGTVGAEDYTFRIYTERQPNWGDNVHVFINYWNGSANVTLIDSQKMTWVANSRNDYHLFYTDITIDKSVLEGTYGVKINFNNGNGTWTENHIEIKDFTSKNYLFYIYTGNDSKYYMSSGDFNYIFAKVANNALSDIHELIPYNDLLTTEIDNEASVANEDYILYPSFATEFFTSDQYNKCVNWNLIMRPKVNSGDYEVSDFQPYTDKLLHGASNGLFRLQLPTKFAFSFDLAKMEFEIHPYIERTIGSAGYATLGTPADWKMEVPTGVTAYYVTGADNNEATMNGIAAGNTLPGNNGFVIGGSADTYNFYASSDDPASTSGNMLVSTGAEGVAAASVPEGAYILALSDDEPPVAKFYKYSGTGNIGAFKAYLNTTGLSAKSIAFNFEDDELTNIDALNSRLSTLDQAAPMYNLAGQKVGKNYKGVVIQNGKKVIVK